jgi:hypothetical protein
MALVAICTCPQCVPKSRLITTDQEKRPEQIRER